MVFPYIKMNLLFYILNMLGPQSCLTLWDPINCKPPGFSVHGILQERILEWLAIPFSRYFKSQFSSVAQLCPTLCDPMNRSTPGLPVHHQLPEFTQTRVHWVRDAIQPISSSVVPFSSCPKSLPASESFPMSQLFTWGGQSTGVSALASFLLKKSQGWSPSEWTGWISCSPRDSQESSPTPQFKSINSSALSFLYSPTLTSIHDYWKNHSLD